MEERRQGMAVHRRGGRHRSRRWLWGATLVVAVGALAGSVGLWSASAAPKQAKASKGTLTVYTFTDVDTQGPQYKNIAETARVYGRWANAHGGVAGYKLNVKFCDAHGTPTAATACARKAVADHAVAVIGSFTFTGDAIVPTLQAAKIPYFGLCCAL